MIDFFDTHAHLQEPEFKDDADAVIARAFAAGVTGLVLPAVDLETARSGLDLARRHAGVYATAGFHPHEASRFDAAALRQVQALLTDEKVVAVGEVGLDLYRAHSPAEVQKRTLGEMLSLAEHHAMPVVVHCRDAWEEMREQMVPWALRVAPSFNEKPLGVLHYFSGSLEDARLYIELGFMISVHTSVTHPRAAPLREVVAQLPLEALVIETDSPYGAPQSHRGQRNEPAFVVEAARQIAEVHGASLETVARLTTENARRLFGVPARAKIAAGRQAQ